MPKVIAFGEALIDMIPEYGEDGPDSPVRAFRPSPGGAPANLAVAVARLGGESWFLGKVGDDPFGDAIQAALRGYGVHVDYLTRTREAPTALSFVTHDAHGERRFSFYRNPSADLLFRADEFPSALFSPLDVFHVCSNTLTDPEIRDVTLGGMACARANDCLISVDVNYRNTLWRNQTDAPGAVRQAMEMAHVVKLSREELVELYGAESQADLVHDLLARGVQLVVITNGGGPIEFFTRGLGGRLMPPDIRAADTTAAGDAFVGGLLYCISRERDPRSAPWDWLTDEARLRNMLDFAARCGAFAASRYGAYEALPTAEEVPPGKGIQADGVPFLQPS